MRALDSRHELAHEKIVTRSPWLAVAAITSGLGCGAKEQAMTSNRQPEVDEVEHCQHVASDQAWPQVLESQDAPDGEVPPAEARRVVEAFREAWQREVLPGPHEVARTLDPCMRTDRDYFLRRVSGASAAQRVAELLETTEGAGVLWGHVDALAQHPWVWEVHFAGWTDRLRPGGTFGGFLTPSAEAIAIVHWPEG
jgi:hypothetical protein